jgi:hypothetical protein
MAFGVGPVQFGKIAGGVGTVGANSSGPTVGIEGGGIVSSPTLAGKDFFEDGMDVSWGEGIPEFLGEVFAPALDRAKQRRMWEGFVRAREGATMQEIKEDSPWFSNVFGPTDYEMGAALYTTTKTMADYEADFVRRMPELREQSAEDMGREFNRMADSLRTGDEFTDALVHKQMMDRASTMMDLHTKHRTAWLQSEQVRMQVESVGSSSTSYNETARQYALLGSSRPMEPEAAERQQVLKLRLLDSMQTSRFQNDQSVEAVYDSSIRGMADRGEFYSIRVLEESGVFKSMAPDNAQKLQSYVEAQERQYKNQWAAQPQVIERIAELQAMKSFGIGGLPAANMAGEINRMWASDTGARLPFYTSEEVGNFAGQAAESYIRRRERVEDRQIALADKAADQQAKDAAEARNVAQTTQAWLAGGIGETMLNSPDKATVERISAQAFLDTYRANPEVAIGTVVNNWSHSRGVVVPQIKEELQHRVASVLDEQLNDGFLQQYRDWQTMVGSRGYKLQNGEIAKTDTSAGHATALQYYGPELHNRFRNYDRAVNSGVAQDAAYRMVFGQDAQERRGDLRGIDSEQTKKNVEELRAAVRSQSGNWFTRTFGNTHKLHPSTENLLATQSAYFFEQLNDPTLLPEDRARQAVLAAQSNGLEFGGAFAWENGRGQQSIRSYLRADRDENVNNLMDRLIRKKLSESGGDASGSVTVLRLQDSKGQPMLHILQWGDDGAKDAVLTGDEIKKGYLDDAKREVPGHYNSVDPTFNPFDIR